MKGWVRRFYLNFMSKTRQTKESRDSAPSRFNRQSGESSNYPFEDRQRRFSGSYSLVHVPRSANPTGIQVRWYDCFYELIWILSLVKHQLWNHLMEWKSKILNAVRKTSTTNMHRDENESIVFDVPLFMIGFTIFVSESQFEMRLFSYEITVNPLKEYHSHSCRFSWMY